MAMLRPYKQVSAPLTIGPWRAIAAAAGVTPGRGSLESGIRIKADAANAEAVYVGPSQVGTTNGFKLSANEEVFIDIDAIDKVYLISAGGGETISFIAS